MTLGDNFILLNAPLWHLTGSVAKFPKENKQHISASLLFDKNNWMQATMVDPNGIRQGLQPQNNV